VLQTGLATLLEVLIFKASIYNTKATFSHHQKSLDSTLFAIIITNINPVFPVSFGRKNPADEVAPVNDEIHLESPVPLYKQMSDIIRREIEAQNLAPGTQLPTERDLARRFSVSMITVRGCVSELVRDGLLIRRQGRGTFVASRKPKATQLIMAIVPDLCDYFCAQIINGVQSVVVQAGYELITASSRDNAQTERTLLDRGFARGVEGMVIVTGRPSFANGYLVGNRVFMPLVVVDSYNPSLHADCFYTNDVVGSYEVTRYLVERGYRRIGHLMGPKAHFLAELRVHGYRRAMREAGISVENSWIAEGGVTADDGYRALTILLRQNLSLDAVFAYNDLVAIGAMRAVGELGRRVPQDFGVAGYGNHSLAAYLHPPLTTVDPNLHEMGLKAATRLFQRIREEAGSNDHRKEILPVRLVTGESGRGKG
jgi:LacI family transcriptional regulator